MTSAARPLPDHPVRMALLDLLAEVGTVTATEAAGRLGYSSGLCSFHLRQLARHGLIEDVPRSGGRARPWQLRWGPPPHRDGQTSLDEDQSYQRWLAHRERAPLEWHHGESFSAVVHLTPAEVAELAAAIRSLLAGYQERDNRPAGAVPVAAITRVFPLLAEQAGQARR